MTKQIQEFLREIAVSALSLNADLVYITQVEDNLLNIPPWVSILPELATVELNQIGSHTYKDDEDNLVKIWKKYEVTQPYTIHIRQVSQEDISDNVQKFLEALPIKVNIRDTSVNFLPTQTEFFMAQGQMDLYAAIIMVSASYGIYEKQITTEKIKGVAFNPKI